MTQFTWGNDYSRTFDEALSAGTSPKLRRYHGKSHTPFQNEGYRVANYAALLEEAKRDALAKAQADFPALTEHDITGKAEGICHAAGVVSVCVIALID